MDRSAHNKLVSFIWNIADDCLRDIYVRGKYRDVILPMVVLRRLDTLLETNKEAVLPMCQSSFVSSCRSGFTAVSLVLRLGGSIVPSLNIAHLI